MQNNQLGFKYSAIAVLFWGMLPIALKLSAIFIDAVSLTWFRFIGALVAIFIIQYSKKQLHQFLLLDKKDWLRLGVAGLFLVGNYVTFVMSLDYLTPGEAQLNFQVAPFFLALGGLLFFKERLNKLQLFCFATLACGMLMFFHPHLHFGSDDKTNIWLGVLIIEASAFCWACYALIQKSLQTKLSSNNIMLCLFVIGSIILTPFCHFSSFTHLGSFDWLIVIFCAINTLVAYCCFGQAIKYWPTASVSAMIALTPVLSFTFTAWVVDLHLWSTIFSANHLDSISINGIIVIVLSVMAMQLIPLYLKRRQSIIPVS